jgi:2-hydroxychromene-2-carboxylate isomerase
MSVVQASGKAREIEFWFEFGSNHSYLSVMRIEDLATKYGTQS